MLLLITRILSGKLCLYWLHTYELKQFHSNKQWRPLRLIRIGLLCIYVMNL